VRVTIDATPEELRDKGAELVSRLAKSLAEYAPDLAERLVKAASSDQGPVEIRVLFLREQQERIRRRYDRQLKRMLAEVEQLIDTEVKKSEAGNALVVDLERRRGAAS